MAQAVQADGRQDLLGALFGVAPATAQAAPAGGSAASYVAFPVGKSSGGSSGGVSKVNPGGSHKGSSFGGYSSRTRSSESSGRTGTWKKVLALLVFGLLLPAAIIVALVLKLTRKRVQHDA